MTVRESIVGHHLFEVFPDNPADPAASGVANLTKSLQTVLQTKRPDVMAVQKYDIPRPMEYGDGFEARYWRPSNSPVIDASGEILYLTHCVEDVTHMMDVIDDAMDRHAGDKRRAQIGR